MKNFVPKSTCMKRPWLVVTPVEKVAICTLHQLSGPYLLQFHFGIFAGMFGVQMSMHRFSFPSPHSECSVRTAEALSPLSRIDFDIHVWFLCVNVLCFTRMLAKRRASTLCLSPRIFFKPHRWSLRTFKEICASWGKTSTVLSSPSSKILCTLFPLNQNQDPYNWRTFIFVFRKYIQ